MWQAEYTVIINAPPEAVWRVLIDLDSYSHWNAYSTSAKGDLRVNGVVTIEAMLGQEKAAGQ